MQKLTGCISTNFTVLQRSLDFVKSTHSTTRHACQQMRASMFTYPLLFHSFTLATLDNTRWLHTAYTLGLYEHAGLASTLSGQAEIENIRHACAQGWPISYVYAK
eukprot:scaffold161655_cov18-Tisochrysis_lutea.AAC.2